MRLLLFVTQALLSTLFYITFVVAQGFGLNVAYTLDKGETWIAKRMIEACEMSREKEGIYHFASSARQSNNFPSHEGTLSTEASIVVLPDCEVGILATEKNFRAFNVRCDFNKIARNGCPVSNRLTQHEISFNNKTLNQLGKNDYISSTSKFNLTEWDGEKDLTINCWYFRDPVVRDKSTTYTILKPITSEAKSTSTSSTSSTSSASSTSSTSSTSLRTTSRAITKTATRRVTSWGSMHNATRRVTSWGSMHNATRRFTSWGSMHNATRRVTSWGSMHNATIRVTSWGSMHNATRRVTSWGSMHNATRHKTSLGVIKTATRHVASWGSIKKPTRHITSLGSIKTATRHITSWGSIKTATRHITSWANTTSMTTIKSPLPTTSWGSLGTASSSLLTATTSALVTKSSSADITTITSNGLSVISCSSDADATSYIATSASTAGISTITALSHSKQVDLSSATNIESLSLTRSTSNKAETGESCSSNGRKTFSTNRRGSDLTSASEKHSSIAIDSENGRDISGTIESVKTATSTIGGSDYGYTSKLGKHSETSTRVSEQTGTGGISNSGTRTKGITVLSTITRALKFFLIYS